MLLERWWQRSASNPTAEGCAMAPTRTSRYARRASLVNTTRCDALPRPSHKCYLRAARRRRGWRSRQGRSPQGRAQREPSRQLDSAYRTEHVVVHYPWHPLHGQTILVQRSMRHGRDVWLCQQDQHTAAIPVWMTDRVACAALSLGPVLVSVEALTELAALVTATRSAHDRLTDVPQEDLDATSTAEPTTHAIRPRAAGRRAADADRAGPGAGAGRFAARQRRHRPRR